jgi:hypothetical protein
MAAARSGGQKRRVLHAAAPEDFLLFAKNTGATFWPERGRWQGFDRLRRWLCPLPYRASPCFIAGDSVPLAPPSAASRVASAAWKATARKPEASQSYPQAKVIHGVKFNFFLSSRFRRKTFSDINNISGVNMRKRAVYHE